VSHQTTCVPDLPSPKSGPDVELSCVNSSGFPGCVTKKATPRPFNASSVQLSLLQETQPSLTSRPMLVHADDKISSTQNATKHSFLCCAAKSCHLVNDCDLLAGFSDFYLPFSHLTPPVSSSSRVHIRYSKTRMAGLQSGEGRMMIDSVVWVQHTNVTDRQTHRQPRRHSKWQKNKMATRPLTLHT